MFMLVVFGVGGYDCNSLLLDSAKSLLPLLADRLAADGQFLPTDQVKDGCPQSCDACAEPAELVLSLNRYVGGGDWRPGAVEVMADELQPRYQALCQYAEDLRCSYRTGFDQQFMIEVCGLVRQLGDLSYAGPCLTVTSVRAPLIGNSTWHRHQAGARVEFNLLPSDDPTQYSPRQLSKQLAAELRANSSELHVSYWWRAMLILPHADSTIPLERVDEVTLRGLPAGAVALLWLVLLLLVLCCSCYACCKLCRRCLCRKRLHVLERDALDDENFHSDLASR